LQSVTLTNLLWISRAICYYTVTDLINLSPGNSSVNTAQHTTIEEAVFSADPTDASIDWLDSDHAICVYCGSMFVPQLYNQSREL
jgi:hypothetical protein